MYISLRRGGCSSLNVHWAMLEKCSWVPKHTGSLVSHKLFMLAFAWICLYVYVRVDIEICIFFCFTFTFEIPDRTYSVYTMKQQYSASTMEQDSRTLQAQP